MPGTSTEDILKRYRAQQKLTNGKRDASGGVNRAHSKYLTILLACLLCRTGMPLMTIAQTLFGAAPARRRPIIDSHFSGRRPEGA